MSDYINRYVYFIRPVGMEGPIKIGCSNEPARRLYYLGVWSPFPLEIAAVAPGTLRTEKELHGRFAKDRLHNEWFRGSARLLSLVDMLRRNETLEAALAADDAKALRGAA